ncbi:MAG: TolC family protein [Phaeodactylibacter sp.]|nr:TolC family protein [Phaeodactylibacter sp.]MCB9274655.1 TolC family protein [Lewinellaceae bacterium]
MKKEILHIILVLFGFASGKLSAQDKAWALQECIDYAITNNLEVQKTELDKKTTLLNYQQSKYDRLPGLSANLSNNLANGSSIDPITSDFVSKSIYSNSINLGSSLTLYSGNRANLQIQKNEILLAGNELAIEESKNNIKLSILEAYVQALYYKESITIAENTEASSQEELQQAQGQYDNGAISRGDLAGLEAQYTANQHSVVLATNTYRQQLLKLKQLLELAPDVAFEIEAPSVEGELNYDIPDKSDIYRQALNTLPDVRKYDVLQESSMKSLSLARAAYAPTVSLSFGLGTGYTSSRDYNFTQQLDLNLSSAVGLTLSVPIFSKFANKTNESLVKIELEQNQLNKQQAGKNLYQSIETAWLNAVSNQSERNSSRVKRDAAKLSYDLARKKYEFGGSTATDLLLTQTNYVNAEQEYLQVKYMGLLYEQLLNYYQGKEISFE